MKARILRPRNWGADGWTRLLGWVARLRRRLWPPLRERIILLLLFPVCLAASLLAALVMAFGILFDPPWAWTMAVSHDQLANAATRGNPDETISSRANRAREADRSWGCILCGVLDWLDRNHCRRSAGT